MTQAVPARIVRTIAEEIAASPGQVSAAVTLLREGATVPFVARYRKEATGGLDDGQLRQLSERLDYLTELEARRDAIRNSIREQGKLDDALEAKIAAAETKSLLEDLYLPFRPKRRSRATIAREHGLAPLLEAIRADRSADPEALAEGFLGEEVPDSKSALAGARDILAEELAETADLLGRLRAFLQQHALLISRVNEGEEARGAKFSDYFDHRERWADVPGHRALAMLRGANEGILRLDIAPDPETDLPKVEAMICATLETTGDGPGDRWLRGVAGWTWRTKLSLRLMLDLTGEMRARAQEEAIRVFSRNLKDLLLAAPAGPKGVIGLDPGIRTGVKVAVVDATGKLLDTATNYPFQPKNDLRGAQATLAGLIRKHGSELIAIGNGTASRETERMVADLLAEMPAPKPATAVVSEAGASVYSASELAAREFPNLDVSLRGAVSIARRLQDPLAELVKIDPKAIGVGQYQHDVDQHRLVRALDGVVEDAVNAVGVDLNMASAPLLARVSGLGPALADAVVAHRDAHGAFSSRKSLLKVPRLGPRAFEQCAGFLRIRGGAEPLDASAVHPESYAVARRIVAACGRDLRQVMGDETRLKSLRAEDFVDGSVGLPTVRDILAELAKPGRDPRPEFRTARFAEGIEQIGDLKPGMMLEGSVTNVAAFGAFVDIGVHQDGLVHLSQLADRFVKDPHEVVKAGDIVRVRVLEVDVPRKRISLSMRKQSEPGEQPSKPARGGQGQGARKPGKPPRREPPAAGDGALGAALRDAMRRD
ncbi:Tex family protein [Tropicimonas sp. IMCC6043]|uniref:Tex family protein n=1 Tax=Tropicimonas sp. IMCC6043 TaxID=2510645 RepID=UPI00101D9522|nr:Tex family protein [Tropicimonas sp. IMCC6043]RYH09720.1 RNA-binding transcriptional accessory protein [Tropicimonas sp. IMCC6043]